MIDLLTFLVEKLSVLSHLKFWGFRWIEQERTTLGHRTQYLMRGDLLEVPRTLFTHYGIYLGDNNVAHLIPDILLIANDNTTIRTAITNKRLILGCIYKCATVRIDTVEDFAFGSKIIVNQMDKTFEVQPFPSKEVANRAEGLIGAIQYSLLWNNCEHFVTHCRYGSATSQQTEKFCQFLKSVIRDQRSVILTVFLGVLSIIWFGMGLSTALPTILIPFTLWMAG